ncbi:MAG: hypothetical protein ACE368_14700 [Paracoccaceae bacterium]
MMMQAGAWPMAPQLGRAWAAPAPATQDGLAPGPRDAAASAASLRHVIDMLTHMGRHPAQGGPEVMQLDRFWHPRFGWYGPAGIGTARGVRGFRHWHQIPFLAAMPDRGQHPEGTQSHLFADGAYVAVTGWPNMRQTLTGGGWLGLPRHVAEPTLRNHPLLAARVRPDPRKLGARRSLGRLRPSRYRCPRPHARAQQGPHGL